MPGKTLEELEDGELGGGMAISAVQRRNKRPAGPIANGSAHLGSSLDASQLETSRLILRVPRLTDLDSFAAMMADEETARFIGGVAAREVTWRMLMTLIGAWHATGVSMFSVFGRRPAVGSDGSGHGCRKGARSGSRMGHRARLLGPRLCDGRRRGGDGVRFDRLGWGTSFIPSRQTITHHNRSPASSARGTGDPDDCRRRSRTLVWISGFRRAMSGARGSGRDRVAELPVAPRGCCFAQARPSQQQLRQTASGNRRKRSFGASSPPWAEGDASDDRLGHTRRIGLSLEALFEPGMEVLQIKRESLCC